MSIQSADVIVYPDMAVRPSKVCIRNARVELLTWRAQPAIGHNERSANGENPFVGHITSNQRHRVSLSYDWLILDKTRPTGMLMSTIAIRTR
jgi:hypothetical protein